MGSCGMMVAIVNGGIRTIPVQTPCAFMPMTVIVTTLCLTTETRRVLTKELLQLPSLRLLLIHPKGGKDCLDYGSHSGKRCLETLLVVATRSPELVNNEEEDCEHVDKDTTPTFIDLVFSDFETHLSFFAIVINGSFTCFGLVMYHETACLEFKPTNTIRCDFMSHLVF